MTQRITEGLMAGDLKDLVLPMLSVDEFSSKIDDNTTIVVGFYCFEEDPAHDLANFVERSPAPVLDTDVSHAPSREGYYLTFVEIKRNHQFPQNLLNILKEVSNLTNISQWQFTSPKVTKGKVLLVNNQNLAKFVNLEVPKTDVKQKLAEFLSHSSLSDFNLDESNVLTLERGAVSENWNMISFGNISHSQIFDLRESAVAASSRLARLLDGPYQVHPTKSGLIVESQFSNSFLVLAAPKS
jgi:DNA polymerase III psi subunit